MEESRGIASSPAPWMAEEPEAITHEAERDPCEEWFISILGVNGPQHDSEARSKHRIPKAPAKFREYENDKKYFDPRVVSLEPCHHGKDHLKPMEKHKITAVKRFLDQLKKRDIERGTIYEKFMELIGVMKGCYTAEVVADLTDDVFARMMFLDGCFVLHFIEKFNEGEKTKLEISNDLIPLIIRDMFLIENQLPFEVLDALMNLRWGSSIIGNEKILDFIIGKVLFPMGFRRVNYIRIFSWFGLLDDGEHDSPLHFLDILWSILLDFLPSNWAEMGRYRPGNFGSVTELKEIGIRFERRYMDSLMDISFEEHILFPRLLLPTMYINNTTLTQLLNLTALEACSETYSGCGVTSYIHFMDILINDDTDVKTLRSKGILRHSLGSHDELVRTWPADVTNDLLRYSVIIKDIDRHRNRTVKISIATWIDKHFGSPWAAISFVAASLLLVFTDIQTYFAAFPRR